MSEAILWPDVFFRSRNAFSDHCQYQCQGRTTDPSLGSYSNPGRVQTRIRSNPVLGTTPSMSPRRRMADSFSAWCYTTPWVKKTRHLTVAHIFTKYWPIFQNSFTVRLSKKFVTKSHTNTPPHPKRVATLPCEISVFKKSPFFRSKWSKLLCKT